MKPFSFVRMAANLSFHSDAEAPQNPNPILRRVIFDNLQARNISPSNKDYVSEVFNEVLSLKNVAVRQINTASIKNLESLAKDFASFVRRKWKEKKISRSAKSFRNHYGESFGSFIFFSNASLFSKSSFNYFRDKLLKV